MLKVKRPYLSNKRKREIVEKMKTGGEYSAMSFDEIVGRERITYRQAYHLADVAGLEARNNGMKFTTY